MQRTDFGSTPVTFTLIAVSVVLFVAGFLSTEIDLRLTEYLSLGQFVRQDGSLFIAELRDVDPWRVLTSAFLHANLTHILFNMYALYLFGPRLEREAGSTPFALTYGAAAAAGGAVFIALRAGEATLAVGASGAVFGLFGVWLVAAYRIRSNPAGRAMFNQLAVLLAINGALQFFIRNIAWEAHAGGLVAGILIGYLWGQLAAGKPNAIRIRSVISGAVFVVSMAVVILL
jgi:membrane associated rhomboid family serine protease